MASIQTAIQLNDQFSSVANHIISATSMMVSTIEGLGRTMDTDIDPASIQGIRDYLNQASVAADSLNQQLDNVGSAVDKNTSCQERFNTSIRSGTSSAGSLVKTIMGLSAVQNVISMVKGQMDTAINRMDTMANFSRTMTAITGSADVANASLEQLKVTTKGTAYGLDVAAAAVQNFTTRGMGIGDATSEVGKWADAVAFYGNGTNEALTTVTDAIGKMLSKGKVEMEQLNRLTDNGINAVGIYAQATGTSAAQVQDNLSKGVISAQDFVTTVSTAFEEGTKGVLNISGAAKEAGNTWATSISNAKAAVTRGIVDMINGINEGLSNAGFGTILDGITNFGAAAETVLGNIGNAAGNLITVLSPVLQMVSEIPQFVSDNWGTIAPIIMGIATAVGIYTAVQAISNGIIAAAALAEGVHAAATAMASGATFLWTVNQYGLNAALLACPITWIIVAIIALIAILYAAVGAVNHFAGTSYSATGMICGAFMVAVAFIGNLLVGLGNFLVDIGVTIWNFIADFSNFLANVFVDPVNSIARLFFGLVDTVLSSVQSLASVLDAIFGTGFVSIVSGARDSLSGWVDSTFGSYGVEVMQKIDARDAYLDRFQYSSAWDTGYSFGKGISNKVSGIFGEQDKTAVNDYASQLANYNNNAAQTAANTGNTAKNTASAAKSLSATSEDLKYIRDMAEQKVINRFTTAEIKVSMTNHNNISNDMDLDGVVNHLKTKLEEEMAATAEGVHM